MEELLAIENVKFERIHKSFLINPNYLLAIKGKAQAYKLEMQCMEEMLPVSRSYSIQVLESKLEELN
jgi:DNA-binding LytR/AlgR family response regulator